MHKLPGSSAPADAETPDILSGSLRHMIASVIAVLPRDPRGAPEDHEAQTHAAVAIIGALHPTDPVQQMLAAQTAAAHFAAIECYRCAAQPDITEVNGLRLLRTARAMALESRTALGRLEQRQGTAPLSRRGAGRTRAAAAPLDSPTQYQAPSPACADAGLMRAIEPEPAAAALATPPNQSVAVFAALATQPLEPDVVSAASAAPPKQSDAASTAPTTQRYEPCAASTVPAGLQHEPNAASTAPAGLQHDPALVSAVPAPQPNELNAASAAPLYQQFASGRETDPLQCPPQRSIVADTSVPAEAGPWLDLIAAAVPRHAAPPEPVRDASRHAGPSLAFDRVGWLSAVRAMPPRQLVALADRIQVLRGELLLPNSGQIPAPSLP